jgi:hypothetical protein
MFAPVKDGASAAMGAPEVEMMARERGPLPLSDALAYCQALEENKTKVQPGCYTIHCICCESRCPVACAYNVVCDGILMPCCHTIPCCICCPFVKKGTHYLSLWDDPLVKVDTARETLACYRRRRSQGPRMYCKYNPEVSEWINFMSLHTLMFYLCPNNN